MTEPPDSGAIPFSQWMDRALYDADRGYYTRRIATVGRRGDFSTSATLEPAFGEAIANWIRAERRKTSGIRSIIEIGGGDGSLALSVLKSLGWWGRYRIQYCMVERSPVLRQQQAEKLAGFHVKWFEQPEMALVESKGRAFIFHNEVLDAFPATLLQWNDTRKYWDEVWVQMTTGLAKEMLFPFRISPESAEVCSVFESWNAGHPPPYPTQRCEIALSAFEWMRKWAPHWKRGAMLTLDYGDTFPELYHRRPGGTLRGYFMHQTLTGREIYDWMGRQDITFDINFSDAVRWGEKLGWSNDLLVTQQVFLSRYLPNFVHRVSHSAALAFLADEHGAGSAFKALVQRPG